MCQCWCLAWNTVYLSLKQPIVVPMLEGVHYTSEGEHSSHLDKWQDIIRVFELRDQFVFYKYAKRATILPKSVVPTEKLEQLRLILSQKLGQYYVRRDS